MKNNKDIVTYFDEIKEQYNYILRKVYYIIRNNPKIKTNLLNTELQNKYNISKRTADSIIKTVQGKINSIRELKKIEVKKNQYRLERISTKLEKLIPILLDLKLKAKEKKLLKQSLEEFLNKRDNQMIFLGSKDEMSCNHNFQLKYVSKINQFIIRVRKDFKYKNTNGEERYVYGKCFFNNHKKLLKEILQSKNSPLTYQIIQRNNKYYLQCTFEINSCDLNLTDNTQGVIGIDFNKDFVAISQTNKYGHLVSIDKMTYRFGSGNKTKNDLLLIINKLVELAVNTGKDIVVEDLNFLKKKSKAIKSESKKGKRYNKTLHSLAYRTFLDKTEQICNRENVGLIKVNPAWTSWIAENKFCDKMKLNIHTGAAFVIARRGMNIKDVV